MSRSDDAPVIELTDDADRVAEVVRTHAHSGGRQSAAEHREHGGDPEVDVAYRYLRHFLDPDDDRLARLAREYRAGDLLSGELKQIAIERIQAFLADHQRRRAELGDLRTELEPFLLTERDRRRALQRAGVPNVDLGR
jgi:tryptophanyl-tRNA synthetase